MGKGKYHDVTKDGMILEDFTEGFYIDRQKGVKVQLKTSPNKYNKDYIYKFNCMQEKYLALLLFARVTTLIIEGCEGYERVDTGIMYKLVQSYSGTINYNRVLKKALKVYGIDRKRILEALENNFMQESERAERNFRLIKEFYDEYNMTGLIELVSRDSGMSIEKHLIYFLDNSIRLENEGGKQYYDRVVNAYAEYMKSIALKNGVDLSGFVSDALKKHREYRHKVASDVQKSIEQEKKMRAEAKAQKAFMESNAIVNNNVASIERGKDNHTRLHDYISGNGGIMYYIAQCKKSKVYFIVTDNFNQLLYGDEEDDLQEYWGKRYGNKILTGDICKAKFFVTEDLARAYLDNIKDREEIKGTYFSIEKIVLY